MNVKELEYYLDTISVGYNDDEASKIVDLVNEMEDYISLLKNVDTEGIDGLAYPFDIEVDFLREDIVDHILKVEDVVKNTKSHQGDYVKFVKVV